MWLIALNTYYNIHLLTTLHLRRIRKHITLDGLLLLLFGISWHLQAQRVGQTVAMHMYRQVVAVGRCEAILVFRWVILRELVVYASRWPPCTVGPDLIRLLVDLSRTTSSEDTLLFNFTFKSGYVPNRRPSQFPETGLLPGLRQPFQPLSLQLWRNRKMLNKAYISSMLV